MTKIKYLILGAGPSGLALAHRLLQRGVPKSELMVLESNDEAGGLCRSQVIDGSPLDIGGGHFLDIRKQNVLDLLFSFLPAEEWDTYNRVAKIRLRGQEIDHPLEGNLWQFAKTDQVDYLESIAHTGSVAGDAMPESFESWVRWKLGDRIAEEYMLPYNRKIWSIDLDQLGTYWLYKLPNVSFRDTLRSCLEGKLFGALPAHGTFFYPKKYGYGEVWRRMGVALEDRLITNSPVTSIDVDQQIVNDQFQAETIISTIPWTLWPNIANIPNEIEQNIKELTYVSIDVDYYPDNLETTAHWIYEPREDFTYHRTLVRHNFCPESRGYWRETNAKRNDDSEGSFRYRSEFSYPINTRSKPEAVLKIMDWAKTKNIIGAGRWGTWEHMNSDIAVDEGMKLADNLLTREGISL